jgi:catechol 2,3-dioxygenase-like lactoylglutathione lyase family enzyme
MEVLSSRILLRPSAFEDGLRWYRDVLGLRVYREYGFGGRVTGTVFFLGGGFLELVSGDSPAPTGRGTLWLQVHDLDAEHARLVAAGADVRRAPQLEPWGLRECWIADPDGVNLVLVEVPATHPIRHRVD